MSVLAKLREQSLAFRKTKHPQGVFLSSVLNKVNLIAKEDGNCEPTDADAIRAIGKAIKEARETIGLAEKGGRDFSTSTAEITLLETFLPTRMGEGELLVEIEKIINENGFTSMKDMKAAMAALKLKHGDNYDPAIASGYFRAALSAPRA